MKRGLSTGSITCLVDENDSSFTKVRNGCKKPKKPPSVLNLVRINADIAVAANSAGRGQSATLVPTIAQSEIVKLRRTVEQLSTVVSNQKAQSAQ